MKKMTHSFHKGPETDSDSLASISRDIFDLWGLTFSIQDHWADEVPDMESTSCGLWCELSAVEMLLVDIAEGQIVSGPYHLHSMSWDHGLHSTNQVLLNKIYQNKWVQVYNLLCMVSALVVKKIKNLCNLERIFSFQ